MDHVDRSDVAGAPTSLSLATSGLCNLECPMCPRAVGTPTNQPMRQEVLELVRPMLAGARYVELHGLGEPLMSPVFWHLLETLPKVEGQFIQVNTNGLLLTGPNIDRILVSPLSRVSISFDAATPTTYHKIRGAAFAKVVANVAALVRRREELGVTEPAIHVNMTLMRENVDELSDLVELAARLRVDAVDAWHLTVGEVAGNDPAWQITGRGWTFSYTDQSLLRAPAVSNRSVRRAFETAKRLGVAFSTNPEELWLPE